MPPRIVPVTALITALAALALNAPAQTYRIHDLTERAAPYGVLQCEGRGINNAGVIAGFEVLPEFLARAIVWRPDGSVEFPPLLPGDNASYAWAVAADGRVLGESQLVTVEYIGHQVRITIDAKAAAWLHDDITDLNTLVTGGDPLQLRAATAASPGGLLVGTATPPGQTQARGFLLDAAGVVRDLGILTSPAAVNDSAVVVGSGFNAGGTHALRWQDDVVTDLHRNPPLTGVTSRAWSINEAGDVVGEAQFHISQPEQAALWTGPEIRRLVPEFTRPQGIATAINRRGQITGFYINLDDLSDTFHGFLWQDGRRIDLLDHVVDLSGWQSILPLAMNDKGQIVGGGVRNNELGHGFLLTPVIPGDLDEDADVDLQDLATLLSCFGVAPPGSPCDIDADGDVDLSDLATLLSNFGAGAG